MPRTRKEVSPAVAEPLHDRWVGPPVAAELLGLQESTLASWRSLGCGPRFSKLSSGKSGAVRYSLNELTTFAADPTAYRRRPVQVFHKPKAPAVGARKSRQASQA